MFRLRVTKSPWLRHAFLQTTTRPSSTAPVHIQSSEIEYIGRTKISKVKKEALSQPKQAILPSVPQLRPTLSAMVREGKENDGFGYLEEPSSPLFRSALDREISYGEECRKPYFVFERVLMILLRHYYDKEHCPYPLHQRVGQWLYYSKLYQFPEDNDEWIPSSTRYYRRPVSSLTKDGKPSTFGDEVMNEETDYLIFDTETMLEEDTVLEEFLASPDPNLFAVRLCQVRLKKKSEYHQHVVVYRVHEDQYGVIPVSSFACTGKVYWSKDGHHLYYLNHNSTGKTSLCAHQVPQGKPPQSEKVLAAPWTDRHASVIFQTRQHSNGLTFRVTSDQQFIAVTNQGLSTTEVRLYPLMDLNQEPTVPSPESSQLTLYEKPSPIAPIVEHHQGQFILATVQGSELTPQLEKVTFGTKGQVNRTPLFKLASNEALRDLQLFERHLVIHGYREGQSFIQIHDLSSDQSLTETPPTNVAFPEECVFVTPRPNEFHSSTLYFTYESPVTDAHCVTYDLSNKQITLTKGPHIKGVSDDEFHSRIEYVTSHDQVQIPMLLISRKGLSTDEPHPMLMRVYGAFGQVLPSTFRPEVLYLLKNDWILAVPYIRGGGECGPKWHQQGMLENKPNSIADFSAAVHYVIEKKYTSSDHLSVWGAGAGGLVVAAVMNKYPDLFRAVFLDSPLVDPLYYVQTLSPQTYVSYAREWGDALNDPEIRKRIAAYAPYQSVPEAMPRSLSVGVQSILHDFKGTPPNKPLADRMRKHNQQWANERTRHMKLYDLIPSAKSGNRSDAEWPSLFVVNPTIGKLKDLAPSTYRLAQCLKWLTKLRYEIYNRGRIFSPLISVKAVFERKGKVGSRKVVVSPDIERKLIFQMYDCFYVSSKRGKIKGKDTPAFVASKPTIGGLAFIVQEIMAR
ncbi:hypothetical protein IWQ62_004262 [Dispira parvispora]|uniref:Prolyl endopeptidase-like n=1 Tax=Dispira parvispora TaxID=1520584 RepID=A0A9W8E5S4_9FUNG|nr:hypothetical protein IWQ62_004262 [Dispira parvispora]